VSIMACFFPRESGARICPGAPLVDPQPSRSCITNECVPDPFDFLGIPVVAVGPEWTPAGGGGIFDYPGGYGTITLIGSGWAITSTIVGDAFLDYGGNGPGVVGFGAMVGFPQMPWNLPRGATTRIPRTTGPNLQPETPWPTDPEPPIKVPGDSIFDSPVEGPIDIPEGATTLDRIILGLTEAAKAMGDYMDGIICATCDPCRRKPCA
jgi:hypothetical protein